MNSIDRYSYHISDFKNRSRFVVFVKLEFKPLSLVEFPWKLGAFIEDLLGGDKKFDFNVLFLSPSL